MPFRLGPWEIGLILVIVLVVFGVGKLPQIGGAVGRSVREFRRATHDGDGMAVPRGPVERAGDKSVTGSNRV
jgi:sec-independent protein translocase protein TatA